MLDLYSTLITQTNQDHKSILDVQNIGPKSISKNSGFIYISDIQSPEYKRDSIQFHCFIVVEIENTF